jgi:hypothetical protein
MMREYASIALIPALFFGTVITLGGPVLFSLLASLIAFIEWDVRYLPDWWKMARISAATFSIVFVLSFSVGTHIYLKD